MTVRRTFRLGSLVLALTLAGAAFAATKPIPCKPCGAWQLDPAASDNIDRALDKSFAEYKPPRPKHLRAPRGDIEAEATAEFEFQLDRMPGPEDRPQLRAELVKLLTSPNTLRLREDRDDIVIEAAGGPTRRVSPGEPHARVDSLGTAKIDSRWRSGALTIKEDYRRKTVNQESYAIDPGSGRLKVTRSVTRPGLPTVTVHSVYQPG
ncbi:MAG: hypothetical protein ABW136_03670 [Steroidobacteraceae bacterium]